MMGAMPQQWVRRKMKLGMIEPVQVMARGFVVGSKGAAGSGLWLQPLL
jgi:hypothetical protein